MKKSFLLFVFAFAVSNTSSAQFPTSVDSIYNFIKSNSVFRNKVNWPPVDLQFKQSIRQAQSLQDTIQSFIEVLKSLNDVHSSIIFKNQYYSNYADLEEHERTRILPIIHESYTHTNHIQTQIIENQYAFISIPGIQVIGQSKIDSMANLIQNSVSQVCNKQIKGVIIDLRLNSGGNIYPMLAGLSAFLPEGNIAFEVDMNDALVRTWKIKKGNFFLDHFKTTNLHVKSRPKLKNIPVVVLTGPATVSAGSMVAIAFKSRKNTVFMGEATANGYTTCNGYFYFGNNLILNLATYFVADVYKKVYKENVKPDIEIKAGQDDYANPSKDRTVRAALLKIKEMSN